MSQKHLSLAVLRASLRCARHRRNPSREALLVRVDCSERELDAALEALAKDGLVRSARDARLTFEGFAVAVALAGSAAGGTAPTPDAAPVRAPGAATRVRSAA